MESALLQFVLSPFGVIGIVIAILILAFIAVYRLTKWATKISVEHSSIVENCKENNAAINDIRKDLAYIKGTLEMLTKQAENNLAQAHSPISLTQKGEEVANELKIDVMVDANWNKIKRYLDENLKDKNPYDIQQFCRETAAVEPEKLFTAQDVLMLKEFAYQKGLSLFNLSIVPAIKIRDKYLQEKGISITEIDNHDPNKKQ